MPGHVDEDCESFSSHMVQVGFDEDTGNPCILLQTGKCSVWMTQADAMRFLIAFSDALYLAVEKNPQPREGD